MSHGCRMSCRMGRLLAWHTWPMSSGDERDDYIRQLRADGWTAIEIGDEVGLSRSQVHRILAVVGDPARGDDDDLDDTAGRLALMDAEPVNEEEQSGIHSGITTARRGLPSRVRVPVLIDMQQVARLAAGVGKPPGRPSSGRGLRGRRGQHTNFEPARWPPTAAAAERRCARCVHAVALMLQKHALSCGDVGARYWG